MKKICKKFKSYAARFTELKSNKSGSPDSGSLNEYNFDLVPEVSGEHFPQKERASFWTTFKWLLWRCMKQQYLDPAFLAAKVLQIFGTSITIGERRTYIPKIILKNSPSYFKAFFSCVFRGMKFILAKTYSHWLLRFLLWSHAIPPVFSLRLLSNFQCKCPSYSERSTVNIIP